MYSPPANPLRYSLHALFNNPTRLAIKPPYLLTCTIVTRTLPKNFLIQNRDYPVRKKNEWVQTSLKEFQLQAKIEADQKAKVLADILAMLDSTQ